jgi:hypothetical protein
MVAGWLERSIVKGRSPEGSEGRGALNREAANARGKGSVIPMAEGCAGRSLGKGRRRLERQGLLDQVARERHGCGDDDAASFRHGLVWASL